jgi:hypothetical protein
MIRQSNGMENNPTFTQANQAMREARKSLTEIQDQLANGTLDQSKTSNNTGTDQFTKQSQASSNQSLNWMVEATAQNNSMLLMDRMMALIERLLGPLLQAFGMVASLQAPPPPPNLTINQATVASTSDTAGVPSTPASVTGNNVL